MRILLWDLDGTLVRGRRFGAFKDYTVPMLEKVFGTSGCLPGLVVSLTRLFEQTVWIRHFGFHARGPRIPGLARHLPLFYQ